MTLLPILVFTPGVIVLLLGVLWMLGVNPPEKFMSRLTKLTYFALTVIAVTLVVQLWSAPITLTLGEWFRVGDYAFEISLKADQLSLPFALLTVFMAGIAGAFSVRYLHRDPGYFRFFLLLHLFTQGSLLVFLAGTLDLLIAGWEIVGITSVLLVGFFQTRRDPVRNALRVFAFYRIADLNILIAVFLMHHWFHAAAWDQMFSGQWPLQDIAWQGHSTTIIAVLLVFAASGKASQGPFGGWLPRAMEGPTPSSAIFYGAIAVHAGAYLLLRAAPLIHASTIATTLVIFIGVSTALISTLVHRTCADAKTSLAYAAQTQLGLIFAEIGMGWTTLACFHIGGHALVRMLQFLRAPSMLHDYHRVHAAAGGHLDATGAHYETLLPKSLQHWLYRIALARGFYDSITDRFFVLPMRALARALGVFEPKPTDDSHLS
jgi:NADH:ubiquinone oxidoreductase subunit 5 (subunit L)/multisubunit Na+/H+ antiporter MnhA subunit